MTHREIPKRFHKINKKRLLDFSNKPNTMTRFLDQVKAQQMSLDEEGKKIHRQTFLHFVKNLASASESTTTICRDGKSYDAAFHTGTPFPGKDFQVCLKVTRCLDEAGRVAPSKHVSPGSTLILASKDWASIKAKKLSLKRDNAAELQRILLVVGFLLHPNDDLDWKWCNLPFVIFLVDVISFDSFDTCRCRGF